MVGATTGLREATLAVPFAFLAGGLVLDAIEGELPDQRVSRFGWFLAGAVAYTVTILGV